MIDRQLPDHRQPAIYTHVKTRFRWLDAGLLWPDDPCNFIAHFKGQNFYIPEHLGLLSVKCAFDGQETYEVGRDRIAVSDSSYLILNEGQNYASYISSKTPVESFAIFFDPAFSADVLRSIITPEDQLLESPEGTNQPVAFFQQLYWEDSAILPIVRALRETAGSGHVTNGWMEEQFHQTLDRIIHVHRGVRQDIESMSETRPSLRVELYSRLHTARDFMDSNLDSNLELPLVARVACFSPHHFLRAFKRVFHETPHQYLTRRRIERAAVLLSRTALSVTEISQAVGFESLGSFSWLFRKRMGASPEAFRRKSG